MKRCSTFLLIVLTAAASAAAYTRIPSGSGQLARWPTMPVSYSVNDRGSAQIANDSEFQAVQAAFQTWQSIPTAGISFEYRGATAVRSLGRDNINLVSFADDSTPLGSGTLAATFSFYNNSTGITLEADILFNPSFPWTTSGETGKYDIQSVLTHEIGHFLGLDHSALISSVMSPFGAAGVADQRTLQNDDIAGVSEIYPGQPVSVGQIRGVITAGGSPVFGAHVVALDSSGTAITSTLSANDGGFIIRSLPSGDYRIYAEPLDLPVSASALSSAYGSARTDFGTTYFGDVSTLSQAQTVQVASGGATPVADIHVLPMNSTGLNLTTPSFAPRLARGSNFTLRLGGQDLSTGVGFSSSSPAITVGSPVFGGPINATAPTSANLQLSVDIDAPLGPKNIGANRGADLAVASGAFVVVDPPPSVLTVSPSGGPADAPTRVTVAGSNFRSGARVYFGGLPGTDVHVLSGNMLDVLSPTGIASTVNVQVFNSDGTSGVGANAYTYFSSGASISSVSPLSGGPMTLVVINGDHFSTNAQNITVRFNGVVGPVVSATTTQIHTLAPYGATSGAITVTMSGQTLTGPVFAVLPPGASSNPASNAFEFIDATPTAGGANLNFTSPDDGVAIVSLPFHFSLFRDIFVAGAPISVTTNGWMSLQPVSTVGYKNGPLPDASATGSMPAALVAPFYDDLSMLPGNSLISTRVVGSAPNRQFVAQWTRMTVLDEEGRDLNASLTFETILYEGSNDIQFVYKTLNGPRSDGSSATIGLQNAARTNGIQTAYNQPVLVSGSFVTYRFVDGQYVQLGADASPPSKPVVQDIGPRTNKTTELAASWTSDDAETGIREFQYAIGLTPGASDVRAFTSTTNNSAAVSGLALQSGARYYFAVRAVNNAGLVSDVGVSEGVLIDPAYQPYTSVIPYAPQDGSQFGGISLVAAVAIPVVLTAMDSSGAVILGPGIRNPSVLNLSAGQQTAKLISEIFGISSFDGWVQIDAPSAGLSVYSATGTWSLDDLDGAVPREPSTDFLAMHPGATLYLVNPSTRMASATVTELGTGSVRTLSIPPRGRIATALTALSEVRSSEGLVATERFQSPGHLGLASHQPVSAAQQDLTFAYGLTGSGYSTTVTLANTSSTARDLTVSFASASATLRLEPYSWRSISLGDFLGLPTSMRTGAIRITSSAVASPGLYGVADIENSVSRTSLEARPALTSTLFVNVFQGNGWYTGLSIATGNTAAAVTFDVYSEAGGAPKSQTVTLAANQQLSRQLSEFVPAIAAQFGGYIRVISTQPIWIWQIYGTTATMASGPPQ